jgi:hypothetical protein
MKTILTILALAALTIAAHAQTNRTLSYNVSNNTVIGPTNTNALTFTNALSFGTKAATTLTNLGLGASWLTNTNPPIYADTNGTVISGRTDVLTWSNKTDFTNVVNFYTQIQARTGIFCGGPIQFETDEESGATLTNLGLGYLGTNATTTRSNLFGSVGISTNIQFVRVGGTTNTLVFSNGLLHSVTTP